MDHIESGGGYIREGRRLYHISKVSSRLVPNFRTLMSIAMAAESIALPQLSEPLRRLKNKPYIRLEDGKEVHSVQLWLRLTAAGARCGDVLAAKELSSMLMDEHSFFREFAEKELMDIYEIKEKQSREQWECLIAESTLKPKAFSQAWQLWI